MLLPGSKRLLDLGRHSLHALYAQMARVVGIFVRGSRLEDSEDTTGQGQ
jgi:hypothetical protein